MHHHGGGGATGHAFVKLLPLWLQFAWVLALSGVTAWTVLSFVFLRGPLRLAAGLHAPATEAKPPSTIRVRVVGSVRASRQRRTPANDSER